MTISTYAKKRSAAKSLGAKRYFTGKPCKQGHISTRFTCSGTCCECLFIRSNTPEAKIQKYKIASLRIKNNKEKYNKKARDWRNKNPDKVRAILQRYRASENGKQVYRGCSRSYAIKFPQRRAANENARRAIKINAMPAWADKEKISEFYKNRPHGYHVDHVIPLVNSKVCGLHVIENLQYLKPVDNFRKHNKFEIS